MNLSIDLARMSIDRSIVDNHTCVSGDGCSMEAAVLCSRQRTNRGISTCTEIQGIDVARFLSCVVVHALSTSFSLVSAGRVGQNLFA